MSGGATRATDPGSLLEGVLAAARAAGERIEAVRRRGIIAHLKAADHPVTAADRAADALLRERLLALLPCAWLSEETADTIDRLGQARCWVVDPLDGTKEFIAGLPEYAVSIGLVEDGRPILGVVWLPATGRAFLAVRGGGAIGPAGPLHVRDGTGLLASRTELARGEFEAFAAAWTVEPSGSIALKLARVASGDAALTLSRGPKGEWDVCAGALLVEEAGGTVTDARGEPFLFNGPTGFVAGIVAGAPPAWARAMDRVRELGEVVRVMRRRTQ